MTSRYYLNTIRPLSQFRMGKIGFGSNTRYLLPHSPSFVCTSLELARHHVDTLTDAHSIQILYSMVFSGPESIYLYGYRQVASSNINYVFGKVDSIYKIWFLKMSSSLDSIMFLINAGTLQLEPILIVPRNGLTNFELLDYSIVGQRPLVLVQRYNENKVSLAGLPSLPQCIPGCDLCYIETSCNSCSSGFEKRLMDICWKICDPGMSNFDEVTCIPIIIPPDPTSSSQLGEAATSVGSNSTSTTNIPYPTSTLTLLTAKWQQNKKQGIFEFNQPLVNFSVSQSDLLTAISFSMQPDLDSTPYVLRVCPENTKIEFTLIKSNHKIYDQQLTIKLLNSCLVKAQNSGQCYNKSLQIQLGDFIGTVTELIEQARPIMKRLLQGITVTYVIFNAPFGILVLKLFQMFDYLKLVNVDLPSNAQAFLQWFEENMFDLIPNHLYKDDSSIGCDVHNKLLENNLSCLMLNNTGNLFQYYFVYISAKILILVLSLAKKLLGNCWRKKSNISDSKVANFNVCIGLEFFYQMCQAIQLDYFVAIAASLRSFSFSNPTLSYNTGISIVAGLIYGFWCVLSTYRIHGLGKVYNDILPLSTNPEQQKQDNSQNKIQQLERGKSFESQNQPELLIESQFEQLKRTRNDYFLEQKAWVRRWLFVIENTRLEKKEELLILNLLNLKDTIIPGFFVGFLDSPILQISLPLLYTVSMSILVWKKMMFVKGSALNLAVIFNEGTVGLLLAIFLVIHITEGYIKAKQKYIYFGWTIIILLSTIIIFNLVLGTYEMVVVVREFFRKRCKKK